MHYLIGKNPMGSLKDHFPNTPLIALVQSGRHDRYFGAFANGAEAQAWFDEQPNNVAVQFIPLRSPHIVRTYDDFYNPAKDYDEAEFNHQQPTAKEKPVMSDDQKPVGAHCIIQWYDSGIEEEQYISFGEYDSEISEDFDSFGQRDDRIFFYCEGGEDELKGLMNLYMSTSHEDFVVKSYQLEYAS
jgi:hypothetical protein